MYDIRKYMTDRSLPCESSNSKRAHLSPNDIQNPSSTSYTMPRANELSDDASGIHQISEMFPDLEHKIISDTLNASGHDVEIAIDTLLTAKDESGK